VAGIISIGLYLRARSHTAIEPESSVEKQRRLVDLLNINGQMSAQEMADALGVDEIALYDLIDQLVHLEIFPGRIDRNTGMIYSQNWETRHR
jgi:hypothetical protein